MLNWNILSNKKTINSSYLGENIYELLTKTFKIPDEFKYAIWRCDEKYTARPDLVSYDVYGSSQYGDALCKLNGISNPFWLNAGMYLVIPDLESIRKFIVSKPVEESMFIDDSGYTAQNTPAPKTKSEKRKANEAILGDTRFIIDNEKGVVIY